MPICNACGGNQGHNNNCKYGSPLPIKATPAQAYDHAQKKSMFDPKKK